MKKITIGSVCKAYREKLCITQEEMAKKLGISRTAYNFIETDRSKRYRFSTIRNISALLNIEPEKLIEISKN